MGHQYGNRVERCEGRLLQFFGVWKVQSGYGTFPLAAHLQSKPAVESNGAWVEATTEHGLVTDYHFAKEEID